MALREAPKKQRQGGFGGQNAGVMLGRILLGNNATHDRAFNNLCAVVSGRNTTTGTAA